MNLTEITIRNAKAKPDRHYKIYDGRNLYIEVRRNGSKYWRLRYRFGGKQLSLSLGTYPSTSLKRARRNRDEALFKLGSGINPSAERKRLKLAAQSAGLNSFKTVSVDWLNGQKKVRAAATIEKFDSIFNGHIFPWIGSRPISEITAPELLDVLRQDQAVHAGSAGPELLDPGLFGTRPG